MSHEFNLCQSVVNEFNVCMKSANLTEVSFDSYEEQDLANSIFNALEPYETQLVSIHKTEKIKTKHFEGLNELTLGNNISWKQHYAQENKSTKKTICALLSKMMVSARISLNKPLIIQAAQQAAQHASASALASASLLDNSVIGQAAANLFKNDQFKSMAESIANKLKHQNLEAQLMTNPFNVINTLMNDSQVQNMIKSTSELLETQISSGALDGEKMEQEVNQLFNMAKLS